jgi:hypothetical protein
MQIPIILTKMFLFLEPIMITPALRFKIYLMGKNVINS